MRFLAAFFALSLSGCGLMQGVHAPSEAYDATIELLEAEATLHRLAGADNEAEKEYFVLRTSCVLKVSNNSGRSQMVASQFGSAYDDLRLRIRDDKGKRIATTAHALLMEPAPEQQWHVLDKGETFVELTTATPVGPEPVDRQLPFIQEKELTQSIQLEYFGGFPGADLRAVQSNRLTVTIKDRTADAPQRPEVKPAERV